MQFLALIEYHILNTYWGAEVQPQAFLISELGGVTCNMRPLSAPPPQPNPRDTKKTQRLNYVLYKRHNAM